MPSALETPETTRRHVDELILDYLLWYSVESLLLERNLRIGGLVGSREWLEASKAADMSLRMVNSYYQTFQHLHPNVALPACTSLRIHICRFASLFLRRLDATAPAFAPRPPEFSAARAKEWLLRRGIPNVLSNLEPPPPSSSGGFSSTPFPEEHLHKNHEELLQQIGYKTVQASQGTLWGNATLKEGLREFMVLTTWTTAYFAEVNTLWMQTAVAYMLQAALEAYRCHGAENLDALNECFSWGLNKSPDVEKDHIEDVVVNEMFAGEAGEVNVEFEALKKEMLFDIVPPTGTPLETHFDNLAAKYPWQKFEDRVIMDYLSAIINSVSKPVLAQLEQGKLEGFGDEEVKEMLSRIGIGR